MKSRFLFRLLLILCFSSYCSEGRDHDEFISKLNSEQSDFINRNKSKKSVNELEKILNDFRSENKLEYGKIVKDIANMGDEDMLAILLNNTCSYEKMLAVEQLADMGSKKSLHAMVEALDRENEFLTTGFGFSNTEIDLQNKEIQKNLIRGIERITNIRCDTHDNYSRESVLSYLNKIKVEIEAPPKRSNKRPEQAVGDDLNDSSSHVLKSNKQNSSAGDTMPKKNDSTFIWIIAAAISLLASIAFLVFKKRKIAT